MAPPAAPSLSSRPVDRIDATHSFWPSRSGTAASAAPAPPITARAASRVRSRASAGTTVRISVSATPVTARAPSTLSPMTTPCSLGVRGINDGRKASRAAVVSAGVAGTADTGFSHFGTLGTRRARSSQRFMRSASSALREAGDSSRLRPFSHRREPAGTRSPNGAGDHPVRTNGPRIPSPVAVHGPRPGGDHQRRDIDGS
jgi:hypothetical protein